MKSLQAFAAGVLVGVLVTLGAGRFLPPCFPLSASGHLAPVTEFMADVVDGFTARLDFLITSPAPAFRRQVTRRLRMARTGVVLTHHILTDEVPRPGTGPDVSAQRAVSAAEEVKDVSGAAVRRSETLVGPAEPAQTGHGPTNPDVDPDYRYAQALEAYRAGRNEESRRIFAVFLKEFPGHALTPNALYWTGETWYDMGRYDRAMEFFARVLAEHPRHAKSPDALLKLAYSALRLGRADLARAYLDQLLTRYPDSGASRLGRQARSRLEGSSEGGAVVVSRG